MSSAKARKLQELRKARGLSVGELGRQSGLDPAAIQRWEGGEEEPDPGALEGLAAALGVSQDELRHEGDRDHRGAEVGA